jgi:26S proteasome regulatory subunit N1
MAQDGEPPKSVDKGKGKAVDGDSSKAEEVKKDKDGKPLMNGKQEDGIIGGSVIASTWGSLANISIQRQKNSVRRTNSSRAN